MKFFSYNFFVAKIDKLKEKLGILKFWLGIVVATLLALVGWLATNYQKADILLIILAVICMISSIVGIVFLQKRISTLLDEIEKA